MSVLFLTLPLPRNLKETNFISTDFYGHFNKSSIFVIT